MLVRISSMPPTNLTLAHNWARIFPGLPLLAYRRKVPDIPLHTADRRKYFFHYVGRTGRRCWLARSVKYSVVESVWSVLLYGQRQISYNPSRLLPRGDLRPNSAFHLESTLARAFSCLIVFCKQTPVVFFLIVLRKHSRIFFLAVFYKHTLLVFYLIVPP